MNRRVGYMLAVLAADGRYVAPHLVTVRAVMLDDDSLCLYTPIRWFRYQVVV